MALVRKNLLGAMCPRERRGNEVSGKVRRILGSLEATPVLPDRPPPSTAILAIQNTRRLFDLIFPSSFSLKVKLAQREPASAVCTADERRLRRRCHPLNDPLCAFCYSYEVLVKICRDFLS